MFPKSDVVGILQPRKRRIVLIVTIFTIAIIIATIGTIIAVTPNNVSMKSLNFVDPNTTNPTEMTIPHQVTQAHFDYKKRSSNITKETLLSYFKKMLGHQTISGLHIGSDYTDRYKGIEIIHSKSGKTPAMLSIEMPSFSAGKNAWQSFTNKIISDWKNGHLILLFWGHLRNPLGSMEIPKKKDNNNWNDLIRNGTQLNKVWKKELDNLAVYLRQIQSAGVVLILDILPYINYPYSLWSARPGVHGSSKFYRITHDYMTVRHGLSSLIWTLSFDNNGKLSSDVEDYWPGDQYVDVVIIYMWKSKKLDPIVYEDVLDVIKGKLIAMIALKSIPQYQLLVEQPQWTWFTILESFLLTATTELQQINATFNHPKYLNRENCI